MELSAAILGPIGNFLEVRSRQTFATGFTGAFAPFSVLALTLATPANAISQDGNGSSSPSPDSPRTDLGKLDDADDQVIVVTARRGEALVAAETELLEEEIGIYGADTIQELLDRIAVEIDGTGDLPEVVINGKRVDPSIVKAFPPEALERLAILDPAAAARYGFDPGKRVVNLVLKENYSSWNAIASVSGATRGGRQRQQVNAGRFVIAGDLRWNVQGSVSHEGKLLESDRDLPVNPGDEWAEIAGLEPQRYETLLPSSTSLSLNSGITHPVGEFSGTIGLNATASDSESLLGLARGGSAAEPDPLRSTNSARLLGLRAGLSGNVAGWRTSASLNANQTWTESRFDRAAPAAAMGRRTDRTEGSSRTLSARVDANRDILSLPAGPAGLALALRGDANGSTTTRYSSDGTTRQYENARQSASLRASIDVPVASRALDVLQPLGDLTVELGADAEKVASTELRWRWNAGGTWSPIAPLRLRASYDYEQRLPTFDQLNAPLVEAVDRVFDFTRQETAEVVRITGGNPDLQPGSARRLSIGAMLRPLGGQALTFNVTYRRDRKVGGISGLPGFTPAVEAAFPERFVRDGEGRLVAIDARPINIVSESSAQLAAGMTARWPGSGDRPLRLTVTLSYRRQLEDTVVTDRAIAPFDRLEQGVSSRQTGTMRIVAMRNGIGGTLGGNWTGAARVAGDAGYRYDPTVLFDLELYAEPEHLWAANESWAKNLKVSLDIANLLAGYRSVTTADGAPAPGFERDRIDPLGRTVKLEITKRF